VIVPVARLTIIVLRISMRSHVRIPSASGVNTGESDAIPDEKKEMPSANKYTTIVALIGILLVAAPASAENRPTAPHGVYSISTMKAAIPLDRKTLARLPSCGTNARKVLRGYQGLDLVHRGSVKLGGLVWRLYPCVDAACLEDRQADHPDPPKGATISVWFRRVGDRAQGLIEFSRMTDQYEVTCADSFSFWGKYRRI
jgi:hypothetical protein